MRLSYLGPRGRRAARCRPSGLIWILVLSPRTSQDVMMGLLGTKCPGQAWLSVMPSKHGIVSILYRDGSQPVPGLLSWDIIFSSSFSVSIRLVFLPQQFISSGIYIYPFLIGYIHLCIRGFFFRSNFFISSQPLQCRAEITFSNSPGSSSSSDAFRPVLRLLFSASAHMPSHSFQLMVLTSPSMLLVPYINALI
jgi:hypothetical protein